MSAQETMLFPLEKAEDEDLSLARSLEEWANAEVMGKRLELKENIEKLPSFAVNQ